jgi:hypothetical protein
MSEATYSMPRHPDHAATVRQVGLGGDFIAAQAVCPCGWTGPAYSGQVGWDSGKAARNHAEQDAAAHRRGNG